MSQALLWSLHENILISSLVPIYSIIFIIIPFLANEEMEI